jgi:hypothetical protein
MFKHGSSLFSSVQKEWQNLRNKIKPPSKFNFFMTSGFGGLKSMSHVFYFSEMLDNCGQVLKAVISKVQLTKYFFQTVLAKYNTLNQS